MGGCLGIALYCALFWGGNVENGLAHVIVLIDLYNLDFLFTFILEAYLNICGMSDARRKKCKKKVGFSLCENAKRTDGTGDQKHWPSPKSRQLSQPSDHVLEFWYPSINNRNWGKLVISLQSLLFFWLTVFFRFRIMLCSTQWYAHHYPIKVRYSWVEHLSIPPQGRLSMSTLLFLPPYKSRNLRRCTSKQFEGCCWYLWISPRAVGW